MLDTHGRKYVEPLIKKIAQIFVSIGLKPNMITYCGLIIGICGGICVCLGYSLISVLLLWISGFLDAVDGSMSRIMNNSSPWGTLLDITFDRIVELSVIFGIALRIQNVRIYLVFLVGSILFSMTVFLTVGALVEKKGVKSFYYQAGLAERSEGFIFLSLMILFQGVVIPITLIFIVLIVITAFQRLFEAHRILMI